MFTNRGGPYWGPIAGGGGRLPSTSRPILPPPALPLMGRGAEPLREVAPRQFIHGPAPTCQLAQKGDLGMQLLGPLARRGEPGGQTFEGLTSMRSA